MGSYASPEAAYWAFFTTFNDRSASGRAGVMSYPHVRVSAATLAPRITDTAEEFEAAASWDAVDRTGWAWTQPITPRVMHRSPDKVHFAGGWTRLRADGSVISRNRLLYIASEMEDGWGIQGAFGVEGYVAGADAEEPTQAAMALIDRMMTTLAAGEVDAWLDCFHYPNVIVFAPGQLEYYETREAVDEAYRAFFSVPVPISHNTRITAIGPRAALVEQSITQGGVYFEQCFLVVERDGVWGASAVSAVRPYG
ncbi:MAG: hypothetical protein OXH38_04960 [Chloroflexi bacterium]|nr:hypothetical protein [Chloroflexota bacterium]